MYVAIAGNIGAGKSILANLIQGKFGWKPYYESVDDNPYLADFYHDMKRWSFNLQMYFLSRRFAIHKELNKTGKNAVLDRTIYEDAEVFTANLHALGLIEHRDYATYRLLYDSLVAHLDPPDLLIYLRSSHDTLMKQIRMRGRPFEHSIDPGYIDHLNDLYEKWFSGYTLGPRLAVDTEGTDLHNNSQQQEELLYRIQHHFRRAF